jgi:NCS1 family nucleobase:cation symporter-1
VFWHGTGGIRRFIDWAGPAVYVVMIVLAVDRVAKAGIPEHRPDAWHCAVTGWAAVGVMVNAVALMVSYFSGLEAELW